MALTTSDQIIIIEQIYADLHEEYEMVVEKLKQMRFDLRWVASVERLRIIDSTRDDFENYLNDMKLMISFINRFANNNVLDNPTKQKYDKCIELCHTLQELVQKAVSGVNYVESNLIIFDKPFISTSH